MPRDHTSSSDSVPQGSPQRPAYDNPVGNKGDLAAGNNVKAPLRTPPSDAPEGHKSDKTLGRKPPL